MFTGLLLQEGNKNIVVYGGCIVRDAGRIGNSQNKKPDNVYYRGFLFLLSNNNYFFFAAFFFAGAFFATAFFAIVFFATFFFAAMLMAPF